MKHGRHYWATYHKLRDQFDLTDTQARAAWRVLRDYTEEADGRRPFAVDIERHPRVAKRVARDVVMRGADVFERPAVPKPVPRERGLTPAPVPEGTPAAEAEPEEWHVSIAYDGEGGIMDVGVSVVAPAGANAEQIRGAVWRALLGHDVTAFQISGVDWRKERTDRAGNVTATEKEYKVEDLPSFKSLAHAAKWKVALIEP